MMYMQNIAAFYFLFYPTRGKIKTIKNSIAVINTRCNAEKKVEEKNVTLILFL